MLTGENNLRKAIQTMLENNSYLYFVWDNFVYDAEKLRYIRLLKNMYFERIKFIFLTTYGQFSLITQSSFTHETYLFHNIIRIPYFTSSESKAWLPIACKDLNMQLVPAEIQQKLLAFSGGIPAIIKSYLRGFKFIRNHEEVIAAEELNIIIHNLWKAFTEQEQIVLKRCYLKAGTDQSQGEILEYFKDTNVIDKDYNLYGKWISAILKDDEQQVIEVKGNEILWNKISISSSLTAKENQLLLLLISSREVVSRDSIGNMLIGKDFSEWSLDKFISRTRKKLDEIGIGNEILETQKGKGYRIRGVKLKGIK